MSSAAVVIGALRFKRSVTVLITSFLPVLSTEQVLCKEVENRILAGRSTAIPITVNDVIVPGCRPN